MGAAIFLGGGGSEHDEALLWDELFEPGQRVIVWPFAHRHRAARQAAGDWLVTALAARGRFQVQTWVDDHRRDPNQLYDADVLVIVGGNTFDLLAYLRTRNWLSGVGEFVERGGRVYGGSAGAILLGADIAIAGLIDANDVGITDTRGLGLLAGWVVHPHYAPSQEPTVRQWAGLHGMRVLAVPERAAVVVDRGAARNTGPDQVHAFTAREHRMHHGGDVWDLAGPS